MEYNIEEEQLKHVLYITYIVPNQTEMEFSNTFGGEDDEDVRLSEEDLIDTKNNSRQS